MPYRAVDVLAGRVQPPEKAFHCESCGTVIQEPVTGCRRMGDGKHRCSDCYFRGLGDELEAYPILPPRIRRRSEH